MNRGDNVYETAVKFIADNDLTEEFLDQIVEFLHANVPDGGKSSAAKTANPSGAQVQRRRENRRCSLPFFVCVLKELSYNPSPWAESEPKKAAAARFFPRTTYMLFDTPGNLAGLVKKAIELGAGSHEIERLVGKLQKNAPIDKRYPKLEMCCCGLNVCFFLLSDVSEVEKMLSFAAGHRVPAFDLLRLLALNETGAALVSENMWQAALAALAGTSGKKRHTLCSLLV
jgi:hypothetical protein